MWLWTVDKEAFLIEQQQPILVRTAEMCEIEYTKPCDEVIINCTLSMKFIHILRIKLARVCNRKRNNYCRIKKIVYGVLESICHRIKQ